MSALPYLGISPLRQLAGLLLSACTYAAAAEPTPLSAPAPLLATAQAIAADARTSWYTHRLEIDPANHRYGLDCSGFVSLVLERHAPAALAAVPQVVGKTRRLAADFYTAFAAAPLTALPGQWQRITRLADAQPGDLIAWAHPDHAAGEDTGHLVFVAAAPVPEPHACWRIRVLDCTSTPHGNDTRPPGTDGIGQGTMWFTASADGSPTSLHWSKLESPAKIWPMVIARWIAGDGATPPTAPDTKPQAVDQAPAQRPQELD
jgi:hypothetical protein